MDWLQQEWRKPHGSLIPWAGLALLLLALFWGAHEVRTGAAEQDLAKLEAERVQARRNYQMHQEAHRAKKDLAQVWTALPDEKDFAPLALGITEEAKRNRVVLPALSYKTEPTPVSSTSKGVLQGTMTGRYEDLRRFLYDIETAEELVYIEDMNLVRLADQRPDALTFNIKIATYLRGASGQPAAP